MLLLYPVLVLLEKQGKRDAYLPVARRGLHAGAFATVVEKYCATCPPLKPLARSLSWKRRTIREIAHLTLRPAPARTLNVSHLLSCCLSLLFAAIF
jgi:hypothetical protein